ncbi:MAG: D-Ala-D-Ala carboxypeptidase family metallohydrolase [Enterovibrio sp.]
MATKNFNPLVDKKLTCTCGHPKCDKRTVKQVALNKMQLVRDAVGTPIRVNSGARCPYHPAEAGKVKEGDHPRGETLDVGFDNDLQALRIIIHAAKNGATGIGLYKKDRFIHLCFEEADRIRAWIKE